MGRVDSMTLQDHLIHAEEMQRQCADRVTALETEALVWRERMVEFRAQGELLRHLIAEGGHGTPSSEGPEESP